MTSKRQKKKKSSLVGLRTYQISWDVHSLTGVFIGLLLFVFFYCGAFALYRDPIHHWERPAERVPYVGEPASIDVLLSPIWAEHDLTGKTAWVSTPTAPHPTLSTWISEEVGEVQIDPRTASLVPQGESHAVDLLYHLHFFEVGLWPETVSMAISGLVAAVAVVSILTGLLVHLPRIGSEFFQFRPQKRGRPRWTDAHKVLGTMTLPFGLVLSFTGAMIGIGHVIYYAMMPVMGSPDPSAPQQGYGGTLEPVPLIAEAAETTSDEEATDRHPGAEQEAQATGTRGTPGAPQVDRFVGQVRNAWPDLPIRAIRFDRVGGPDAVVAIIADDERSVVGGSTGYGAAQMMFHAGSGELLSRVEPDRPYSASSTLWQLLVNLHFGVFGRPLLKPVYFLLALAFCIAILSGNVIWTATRRSKHPERIAFYDRLDRLTVGVAAGILPATAALFLANKVIPADMVGRGTWEQAVFWLCWLGAVTLALRTSHTAVSLKRLLFAGGLGALLLPVANGLATGDWLWTTPAKGLPSVFGFDLAALMTGVILVAIALRLQPRTEATADASSTRPATTRAGERQPASVVTRS